MTTIPASFLPIADVARASWRAHHVLCDEGGTLWRRYVAEWVCHQLHVEADRSTVELLEEVLRYATRVPELDDDDDGDFYDEDEADWPAAASVPPISGARFRPRGTTNGAGQ